MVSATATASLTRPGSNAVFYTDSNNQQHPLEAQVDFAANNKVEINTDQAGTTFHVTWGMWLYIPNGQGQTEMLDSWPVPAPFDGDITVGMAGHWEESHTLSAGPFWYPIGDYYASTTASILVNGNTGELKQSGAFFHVQLGS